MDKEVYAKFYFLDDKPRVVWKRVKKSQVKGFPPDWIMTIEEYEAKNKEVI